METKLMVAVHMITYNHESYIARAIDSVLGQKTNFRFKLFVGEDSSTDRTREICRNRASLNEDRIQLILHSENIGATRNSLAVLNACIESGARYIAQCEGDDFWCDPLKLQKQISLLMERNDISLCFHRSFVNKKDSLRIIGPVIENNDNVYSTKDLLRFGGGLIPTASVVYRSEDVHSFYLAISESKTAGDYVQALYLSTVGSLYCLGDVMSVYTNDNLQSLTNKSRSILGEIAYKKYVMNLLTEFDKFTDRKFSFLVLNKKIKLLIGLLYRLTWVRIRKAKLLR